MNNLNYAIKELLEVNNLNITIPNNENDRYMLYKALLAITPPTKLSDQYYKCESFIISEQLETKKITTSEDIKEVLFDNIYIWQGDITTLKVDAIVNAANEKLLGCFIPHHNCIDNAIHTNSGLKLRNQCAMIMDEQGHDEEAGYGKITSAFNLPSKYVIHTVGPNLNSDINRVPTERHITQLKNCYQSCLNIAGEHQEIETLAFCSISTGVYGFPIVEASSIALQEIDEYMRKSKNKVIKVIIVVFSKEDYNVYKKAAENYRKSKKTN